MTLIARIAAAAAVLAIIFAPVRPARAADGNLDIYFIDVDGGAATLIVTPEKETILIDTGWPGRDDRDPKRIAHVLKNIAGRDHLDHVVITHWHVDHFGGVEGLSRMVPINRFWDRGLPEDNDATLDFPEKPKPDDPLFAAYRKASAGKRKALKASDTLPLKGKTHAVVVASGGKVYMRDKQPRAVANTKLCEAAPPDKPIDNSDNARSVALVFRLGTFDFLDCGDLTWNVEKALVCDVDRIALSTPPSLTPSKLDVFQVTHHGLDISNNPILLKTTQPKVAIMNNGPRKGGSPATVRLFKSLPSVEAFYALHKNAATGPDDNASPELTANNESSGGTFIRVSVAADGATYSVRIGENGAERRFNAH